MLYINNAYFTVLVYHELGKVLLPNSKIVLCVVQFEIACNVMCCHSTSSEDTISSKNRYLTMESALVPADGLTL